ncbi:RdgB/HAM1 family non-canonical purine NTP pyrophosphatase [Portibacter marinus]|uniref:RdgB/HAM1 family non-canonical purine NTP pyrophosphatase n=1 Tax=Portibacter marinus TaxID=2898660 RepID=UPI001F326A78|nr:RdgB/HAM1 family non-canonical purine NTP pyrophosphatase [Portibacter marinus]
MSPKIKELLFATGNKNKVKEIRAMLSNLPYHIVTMAEVGFYEEIPETGKTLEENAILKAKYLHHRTGKAVISEDTGLEVDALNGNPGVHTARYAGDSRDANQNMDLLLYHLKSCENRNAQFRTVIALIDKGSVKTFEGIVRGYIANEKSGDKGFGYDPIFIPEGFEDTFGQMDMELKSTMSHRSRALRKLIEHLEQ